jgi:hypothetical protein
MKSAGALAKAPSFNIPASAKATARRASTRETSSTNLQIGICEPGAFQRSFSAFNWSRNSDELTNEFAAGFVGSNVGIYLLPFVST